MSESDRIQALAEYQILDTEPEKDFDEIVDLASKLLNTPIAAITLIDSERLWFKSVKGLEIKEAARKDTFCNYAIQNPQQQLTVSDALNDERFSKSQLVVDSPNIRFYAGCPLVDENNYALGTLCVVDDKPRQITSEEQRMLDILARKIMELMELRKKVATKENQLQTAKTELQQTLDRLREAQNMASIGSWDWNIQDDHLFWSPEMYRIFRMSEGDQNLMSKWQDMVHPNDIDLVRSTLFNGLEKKLPAAIEYRILTPNGVEVWVETKGQVEMNESGDVTRMWGTVQDITDRRQQEAKRLLYLETLERIIFDLSHNVRQPLSNILGIAQVMEDIDLSVEEIKELTSHYKVSALEFEEITRSMNDFIWANKQKISA